MSLVTLHIMRELVFKKAVGRIYGIIKLYIYSSIATLYVRLPDSEPYLEPIVMTVNERWFNSHQLSQKIKHLKIEF